MHLACTPILTRARWAAQLALSTLVLMTGCADESDDTETETTASTKTSNPTTATDGTNPTTATDATDATNPTDGTNPTDATDPTIGDDTTTSDAVLVDYMMDIQPIWDTKCVAGCHTPGGAASTSGPLLGAEVSYANLVNKMTPAVTLLLVAPNDPDASYLWHKLVGTHNEVGGNGSRMPLGVPLDDPTLDLIEEWILQGATL